MNNDFINNLQVALRQELNRPIRTYVIGSTKQADQIKKCAEMFSKDEVRYVTPRPGSPFNECVRDCFDNIDWADVIYAVPKEDGTFGEGVTYEMEYAKRLKKIVFII